MHWEKIKLGYTVSNGYAIKEYQDPKFPQHKEYIELSQHVGKRLELTVLVANLIKNSKDDFFMFILTNKGNQYLQFCTWLTEQGLNEYVIMNPEQGFTNPNYTNVQTYGSATIGNLRPVILASKGNSLVSKIRTSNPALIKNFNSSESVATV